MEQTVRKQKSDWTNHPYRSQMKSKQRKKKEDGENRIPVACLSGTQQDEKKNKIAYMGTQELVE